MSGNPNSAQDFLNFRVLFPKGYNKNDQTKKWPVILFLHGAGEGGRKWSGSFDYDASNPLIDNNYRSLIHGGNEHKMAVVDRAYTDPNSFAGIVIFPQVSYNGSWSDGWNGGVLSPNQEYTVNFVEWIIANYNGDINKVAVHGLSNGGKATWDFATKRPDLFSCASPFSGVPYDNALTANLLYTMPIREYQGGVDTNPTQSAGQDAINAINAAGGNARLIVYPTLGHGTWQTAMAEPDFFSWINQQDKRKIYVVGQTNKLCNVAGATKRLAFSAGFKRYWWHKVVNGVDVPIDTVAIPTAKTRELLVVATDSRTSFATYKLKFMRKDGVWYDSFTQDVVDQGSSTLFPVLKNTGSMITPYTREDGVNVGSVGQTLINLVAPAGYSEYDWYRDGATTPFAVTTSAGSTTPNIKTVAQASATGTNPLAFANAAGTYTVKVKEVTGCYSQYSNTLTMTYNASAVNSTGDPNQATLPYHTAPTGTTVTTINNTTGKISEINFANVTAPTYNLLSETSIKLNWTETVPDEDYFEIWRYRQTGTTPAYPGAIYEMIGSVPANTTSFIDNNGVRPGAQYNYRIRAIKGTDGRFGKQPNARPTILADTQSPTTPTDLKVTAFTQSTVSLSWTGSTDNDVVYRYEIFVNGVSNGYSIADITDTDKTDGNPAPPTTYTATGLDPGTTYIISVRALDYTGNASTFAESVLATTNPYAQGIAYKYYKFTGTLVGVNGTKLAEPRVNGGFDFVNTVPNKTGVVTNYTLQPAITDQAPSDPNMFVLAFDGYVQILTAGNYRFFTNSDDGSRLYIDGNLVVNNDRDQGPTPSSGIVNSMTVGYHTIRVTFYEQGGGQQLDVKWTYSASAVPDATFGNSVIIPDAQLWYNGSSLTNFYSKSTGDLNVLSTWGTGATGTGTAPTSFTSDFQVFNVANRTGETILSAPWVVSGKSSKVVVGTNITLTLNEALTANVFANANSVINLNHATLPQLVKLDSLSTVNMKASGTVPLAVYGNLNLQTASGTSAKVLPITSTLVKGALTVDDQVSLKGTTPNASQISVTGNVTFNGSSGSTVIGDTEAYALALKGNAPHTLNVGANDLKLYGLSLDYSSTLDINFNGATSGRVLTIGAAGGSQGLLLRTGSTLNLNGHTLAIKGVYGLNPTDDSGAINSTNGNISLDITSAISSNLYFTPSSTIQNLTFSNTKTGQLNINTVATLNNTATFNATTNVFNNFIVKSDASGTARIATIPSGAKVKGDITVQRYMDGEGQIYRYISSPVKDLRVVDLQQYFPITGAFTGADVIQGYTSTASMMSFDGTTNAYKQFPATTNLDTLRNGVGYSAYIREATNPTTWQGKGVIHQGTVAYSLVPDPNASIATDGYNLLGNPYPSPIKWTGNSTGGWTASGISPIVSIRENYNGGSRYRTYSAAVGGTFNFDGTIAIGQAFWVQSQSATPTLTVSEAAKVGGGEFYREAAPSNLMVVTMKSATLEDQTIIHFDANATPAFDRLMDGIKLNNSFFNISTLSSDNVALVINNITGNICSQDIKIRTTGAAVGGYSLVITGKETIEAGDQVILLDAFTNTQTTITGDLTYPFSITSDVNSKADGRFKLRFIKPGIDFSNALAAQPGCDDASPLILVQSSQAGVSYQAFANGVAISDVFVGNGGQLSLPVKPTLISAGKTNVSVQAGFGTCGINTLQNTVNITKDLLAVPTVAMSKGVLSATITDAPNATFQWFKDGNAIANATSTTLTLGAAGSEGNFITVQALSGGCVKTSDVFYRQPLYTNMNQETTAVCNNDVVISLDNSQEGAQYIAYYNGSAVSAAVDGTGSPINVTLNSAQIGDGEKVIQIMANVIDDAQKPLDNTITITHYALSLPVVTVSDATSLTSSVEGASYAWYVNGVELFGENTKSITPSESGSYSVKVTKGLCTETSAPVSYTVTGLGDDATFIAAYPNPARDKVVVTAGVSLSTHAIRFQTVLGQTMTVPMSKLSDKSIELDITQVSAGLYLLHVNGKTIRIAKE
ncbi:MAG: PA14 domain-containing protein [Bacteroidota bacterium]